MTTTFKQYIFSFDTIKGLVLTLSLALPMILGVKYNAYPQGFAFALGTLFTFLPNTDGSNRHRFWGILSALVLCLLIVAGSHFFRQVSYILFLIYFCFAVFAVAMISVFGFRGAMVAFSGQMAIVMSFALLKTKLGIVDQLTYISLGGLWYLFLAWASHYIFQNKNAALNLADCIESTADFLKLKYQLFWNTNEDNLKLEQELLKLQVKINSQHELLRELLYKKRRNEGQSNKTNRLLLIFLEMLDVYELSLAVGSESERVAEIFTEKHQDRTVPLKNLSAQSIVHLYALADALKNGTELLIMEEDRAFELACENEIRTYVDDVKLPQAREGALLIRNLLDYKSKQWQKISLAKRVYANIIDGADIRLKRKDRNLFITSQDYSLKTIKANLSFKSNVFRHALRVTVAMLIGLAAGRFFEHQNAYWILLSIGVILRPNFGLTKQRAIHRIFGTIGGAGVAILIVYLTKNTFIYGLLAVPATFIGFTFLQKNYRIAATFITLAIILFYATLVDNTLIIIGYRVVDTLIGGLISFFAIYFFWPSWEGHSIKDSISDSVTAISAYLKQIDRIYHSKEAPDTTYRLARKKAFIDTGNLMAAFQRLTEEPKSQQDHVSQVYGIVVLNQTFLNAAAALGTYIQNHETTPASRAYETMMAHILDNLQNVSEILNQGEIQTDHDTSETEVATEELENKYRLLESERAEELEKGQTTISAEMRNKLQEGKLITDQLKWLYSLSESMKQLVVHLKD